MQSTTIASNHQRMVDRHRPPLLSSRLATPERLMEKPNADTVAWYHRLVPTDARAQKGQMFGHPCAFVNGNMFFGTFAQTLIVRVGEVRAGQLLGSGARIFEPMPGRAWKEYAQVDPGTIADSELATLAQEALEATARLPAKAPKGKRGPWGDQRK